jgi:hypothetical protein
MQIAQLDDLGVDGERRNRVEARRWLVEQQQPRPRRHGTGNRNPSPATVNESKSALSWNSIPMSSRTCIISASLMVSMRLPLTWIIPEIGFQQPENQLQHDRLSGSAGAQQDGHVPGPDGEAMSRRTIWSSNASDT